jgi:sporulation protein YlmC with PRC-barrel domain
MTHEHTSNHKLASGNVIRWEACYGPTSRLSHIGRHHDGEIASIVLAIIVMLGLVFVVASGKPALSQGIQLVKVDVSVVGKGLRASKLIGSNVVNEKNESVGKLDDIVFDNHNGMFAVLQVGGFLGLGSHLVAVPYNSLRIADNGRRIELPGASKDELKKLTEFKYLG